MGQRKFRLSDMMPNTWFYKLRDMRRAGGRSGSGGMHRTSSCLGSKGSTRPAGSPRPVPVSLPHRTSYYCASRDRVLQLSSPAPQPTTAAAEDRHQLVPRTQSPSRRNRRRHEMGPVVGKATVPELAPVAQAPDGHHRRRDTCIGRDGTGDVGKLRQPAVKALPSKNLLAGKVIASDTDIIFDLRVDDMPERVLRPIVTRRPARYELKKEGRVVHHGTVTPPRTSSASEQGSNGNSRRSSVSSSGRRLKTRANSPRLTSRGRKSKPTNPAMTQTASPRKATTPAPPPPPLAESFAVVKASVDPRKDFRESMEEMIAEKGIRGAGDLEDLLACYLALNAAEHHDLIVEVFEEIWANLASAKP